MPTKAIALPEWTPDLADNVLTQAVNVRVIENGYAPVKGPLPTTASLPALFNGGGAFIDTTGASTLLAATSANVYKYTGAGWLGVLTATANQTVRFAQFGDNVLIANGGAVKSYGLLTGNITTPTATPNAIDIAQVRDFVMCITTDNAAQWCQFNNSAVWTTGANQADKQPSLWGQLRRIIGGEYGILITDRSVIRATYVGVEGGLDIIWQFDQISAEVGCMAAGSVCNVGRLVFFLSERGFMMCDGNEVTPIADEKFNRWLFSKFSRADIQNMVGAIDPRNSQVLWAMPGTPGTIIAYNWVLKKATTYQLNVTGMFTGYSSGTSLEALDAIYGNLDAMTISLDDPSLAGGNPVLLIADSLNALNSLAGDNLQATLELDNVEPTSGARSRINSLRLVTDSTSASATIDARMQAGDPESIRSTATMRSNGKLPIRSNGRYNSITVTIPAATDWSYVRGIEVEYEPGAGR